MSTQPGKYGSFLRVRLTYKVPYAIHCGYSGHQSWPKQVSKSEFEKKVLLYLCRRRAI